MAFHDGERPMRSESPFECAAKENSRARSSSSAWRRTDSDCRFQRSSQLQGPHDLAQHRCQLGRRVGCAYQFFALLALIKDGAEQVMRAGDDLQRLAEIVARHRQQCRRKILPGATSAPELACCVVQIGEGL